MLIPITRTVEHRSEWRTVLFLLLMVTALSACGRSYSWELRGNFVNSCIRVGNSSTFCTCKLEMIEENFTEEEFVRMERQLVQLQFFDPSLNKIIIQAEQTCPR